MPAILVTPTDNLIKKAEPRSNGQRIIRETQKKPINGQQVAHGMPSI
jgi:hypothetical protein